MMNLATHIETACNEAPQEGARQPGRRAAVAATECRRSESQADLLRRELSDACAVRAGRPNGGINV